MPWEMVPCLRCTGDTEIWAGRRKGFISWGAEPGGSEQLQGTTNPIPKSQAGWVILVFP